MGQLHLDGCFVDMSGNRIIDCFLNSPEFLNCETVREQIYFAAQQLVAVHRLSRVAAFKELSKLFGYRSIDGVRKLFELHSKHLSMSSTDRELQNTKSPGRPCALKRNEILEVVTFVTRKFVQRIVVSFEMICEFVSNDLNVEATPETLRKILHENDVFRSVEVKVEEEGRLMISPLTINKFFEHLTSSVRDVPAALVINADEVGFQEFIDFKNVRSCVPSSCSAQELEVPMKKTSQRSTALVGISLSGTLLKPLLVLKRKTIDTELIENGYEDKAIYSYSESGYINGELFTRWLCEALLPYIQVQRQLLSTQSRAILIVDGCSVHLNNSIQQLAENHNINLVFLPPHSSHLLQPLDLGIFGVFKGVLARMRVNKKRFSDQSIQVIKIIGALSRTASPLNIVSAFRAAGIVPNTIVQEGRFCVSARVSVEKAKKARLVMTKWTETGGGDLDREVLVQVEENPSRPVGDVEEILNGQLQREQRCEDQDMPDTLSTHRRCSIVAPCGSLQTGGPQLGQSSDRPQRQLAVDAATLIKLE